MFNFSVTESIRSSDHQLLAPTVARGKKNAGFNWGANESMENTEVSSTVELDGDQRRDACSVSMPGSSGYGAFGQQKPIHQIMGGAADLILWKRQHVSFGVIIVATVTWLLFERSGLPFLSVCSDISLILIVLLFLWANYAALRNKQLQELPELVLSEEMVNYVASLFRVKINAALLMAHDITLGKDFRLFFKVVVCLWLLSVVGSLVSFFTLAYIGAIISITIPALYNKYGEPVDRIVSFMHRKFSRHYKIVDENVIGRIPPSISKNKDA
ncbi:hypothetical protein Nepgr_032362 [Nepenthes gracilis]|uniref:Reticulon-like protein n=1 Tax=Nepenthes gracilis TaxID=150966 RepID=A0AAD3TJV1_NEPGR|nr:hypothetical protein Nepgr_032362 [Nepenthes gracilis]